MDLTGNTVLVTGGGSGIGRGLAETLHWAGNRVVVAGRRRDALRAVAETNAGIEWHHMDLAEPASIAGLAAELTGSHPGLNVLVNNAGVMHTEDLRTGDAATAEAAEIAETTVAVNLLGRCGSPRHYSPPCSGNRTPRWSTSPPLWRSCPKRPRRAYSATKAAPALLHRSRCAISCATRRSR